MEALIEIEIEIETQVETQAETETETKLTCETRTEINKKAQCFWLTLCDSLSALFKLHNSATNNEMLFVCLFFLAIYRFFSRDNLFTFIQTTTTNLSVA